MFDPELWRCSKVTVIVLVSLGALLVVPAGFVFLLAGLVLTEGNLNYVITESQGAWLFFSAVGASATGTIAWAALIFLLAFQRHSIRAHLFTWTLVIAAGFTCLLGSLFWVFGTDGPGNFNNLLGLILFAVIALSPVLIGLGFVHFRRARRSLREMS